VAKKKARAREGERPGARGRVEPPLLLVHFIRDVLGLTRTQVGCDTSDTTNRGACTFLLDGHAVKPCTVFAIQADGHRIRAIEGVAQDGQLHPLQEGFKEEHGLQCGLCTPGMILSAYALLEKIRIQAKNKSGGGFPGISAGAPGIKTSSRRCSMLLTK
jgi:carbon-monoxide dehydrogenase small subunit